MTLEEFAKDAGVEIVRCDKDWGGTYGFTIKDSPNCTWCGFRSERAAYQRWLESTFGDQTATAIKKLLRRAK